MIFGLAIKDLRHDLGSSLGLCVALAAVLAPLLLLFAIKTGITGALFDQLRSDPRNLQLQFLNDSTITSQMQAEIAMLPGVGFAAPLGRQIAETVELTTPALRTEPATLQSSGTGDPFLRQMAPPEVRDIILSQRLSERLELAVGESAIVILSNRQSGDVFEVDVTVTGISPDLSGRFVLAHPELTLAVQSVAAGTAVPAFDIPGNPPLQRDQDVTRMRLYAANLTDVAPLVSALEQRGFIIGSQAVRIKGILQLERNLAWLLGALVTIAAIGYTLALSVSLWVNVQRKRKSLAMLRLMGLQTRDMILFPLTQAASIAVLGTLVAIAVTISVAAIVNIQFAGSLPADAKVAQITLTQAIVVLVTTVAVSVFSGSFGGLSISKLQPKEALRDV